MCAPSGNHLLVVRVGTCLRGDLGPAPGSETGGACIVWWGDVGVMGVAAVLCPRVPCGYVCSTWLNTRA